METPDLLSIGDATIDVFMLPSESEGLCTIDTKQCLIAFPYGEKIPVKNLEFSIGGNAANNSVGTRRLGLKNAIILTLGQDSIADMILARLKSENVDPTYVIQQPATTSNYSTIINYMGERTIFTYHAPRSYEFPVKLPVPSWVYLTSMGESFRPFYNHVVEWLIKNPSVKLAFNPGSWQVRAGTEEIGGILKLSHMIYVNREEAEKLTNFSGDSNGKEKELLQALGHLGPKISVITDGAQGVFAYNGQAFFKCGVLPVDAYERTGAGDAFGSGTLSALIKGKTLDEALLWGTVNSASVIGYTGSQRGLLKEDEIQVWLERAKSSGVKVEQF
ncbi:MAG: carbohydrate kinase family protein [Microgenomates group bacterium]